MKPSILARSAYKDLQFANFFLALNDADIYEKDAAILRQLFAEILAGISEEKGSTGFKNPIVLSSTKNLAALWESHGLYNALNGICIAALKRGAAFSQIRRFARAYNGEKFARGFFFKANVMLELANRGAYDECGNYYKNGVFYEDGKLIKYRSHRVYKVGKAYFVEGITGVGHWPSATKGRMWVPVERKD